MSETATSPEHLMQLFAERVGEADIDGVMALYDPDAVFQPQAGVLLEGAEQIRAGLSEFMALSPKITFEGVTDVAISGDIALVSNNWAMTGVAPDGSEVTDHGLSADVVRRKADGSWLVLIDQPRGGSAPT